MSYKVIEQLLTPNPYSRPQMKLRCMKGIVIHWCANPNTSAKNNRDFFESRKGGLKSFGSAHEVIDLDGDVIICIPKDELAYHVGSSSPYQSGTKQIYTPAAWEKLNTNLSRNVKPYPNNCTYGIEATHIDWEGKMTDETYSTLVERCADLCIEFGLKPLEDIYTHQEVVGWKDCHRWFVRHPNEWKLFKEKVNQVHKNKLNPPKKQDEYPEANIVVNDKEVGKGINIIGVIYVPLRSVAQMLGYQVDFDNNTKTAYVNGKPVSDTKLINNVSYVSIRKVGEMFGCKVWFENSTKTVIIIKLK